MNWTSLTVYSALLGVGLAMDAFSVSAANGLADPSMSRKKGFTIAGTFSFFQFAMPLAGWALVHTLVTLFSGLTRIVHWIGFVLLILIGGKMILEGIRGGEEPDEGLSSGRLLLQGIATSIDALSVGFAIADFSAAQAFYCSAVIAVVTLFLCLIGVAAGKLVGRALSGKASVFGGLILVCIGIRILLG